jgi:hypothetical protein
MGHPPAAGPARSRGLGQGFPRETRAARGSAMNANQPDTPVVHQPKRYALRITGHLEQRRADWYEGLTFTHESAGTTLSKGPLADQAVLHGVLTKLRDLALPIIPVQSH